MTEVDGSKCSIRAFLLSFTSVSTLLIFSSSADAAEKLSIRLNWATNVEDAGILIPFSQGTFKKEGIALKIFPYTSERRACEAVGSGQADIGIEDTALFIKCREQYGDLVAFAAKFQINPIAISVLDSKIKELTDLKGTTVSTAIGDEIYADIFKKKMGFRDSDLKVLLHQWNGEGMRWLVGGKTKASIDFEPNLGVALRLKGHRPRVFRSYEFGYDMYGHVYIARRSFVESHIPLLTTFLSIAEAGWKKAFKDPEGSAKIVVSEFFPFNSTNSELSSAEDHLVHQSKELMLFKPYMQRGVGERMAYMNDAVWERNVETLRNIGYVPNKSKAGDFYTLAVLRRLYSIEANKGTR